MITRYSFNIGFMLADCFGVVKEILRIGKQKSLILPARVVSIKKTSRKKL
jgi:hypothetical protein